MKTKLSRTSSALATFVLLAAGVSPALASTEGGVLSEVTPDVLQQSIPAQDLIAADGSELFHSSEESSLTVPVDPQEEIVFRANDSSIRISLPFSDQASEGVINEDNQLEFDNENATQTIPVTKADGSIQITTVLESKESPERYDYELSLPAGAVLVSKSDGSVHVESELGLFIAGFAPPWALDSAGKSIPTNFELSGTRLTQVVAHRQDATLQYPIVADPWLGQALISQVGIGYPTATRYVINVTPTAWGRQANKSSMVVAHRDELVQKLGPNGYRVTSTIREQLYCHVIGNFWERGIYNLESWRPYMAWNNQLNLTYQCNPY